MDSDHQNENGTGRGALTEQAKTRAEQAETRAEQAKTTTAQAQTETQQAGTHSQQAETQTEQARTRTEQAGTQTDQAKTRTEQARTRNEQAETGAEQARTRSMEQALRASELSYRRLFEAAQDGILILDVETGRISDVNPFLVKLLGFSHDEMVGQTVGELSPFKDVVSNQAMLERLQKDGYVRYENLPLQTRDGRHIAVEFVCNVYQAGTVKVIQCNIRDITKRKLAEANSNLLAAIVESSDDAIIGKDLNGLITSWNQGAEKIFGYPASEMVGTTIRRLIPADRQDEEDHILEKVRRGEGVMHFETRRQTRDGRRIDVSVTVSPIKDAGGRVTGVSKVLRDVSERKRVERLLQQSEAEFRSLAETMPQIVWATRADGGNTYFNQHWMDYTGLTLEESLGDGWNKPFHPEDRQRAWDAWQAAVAGSVSYSIECRLRRADGIYRWWWILGAPFRADDGRILKWFGTCTDITERRQAEEKILQLNVELERRVAERTAQLKSANEELEAFSYSVSHDLRAPLRHVTGFVNLLQKDAGPALSEKSLGYLATISRSAKRMGDLIDDLLSFSRVGRAELQTTDIHLDALVQDTLGDFQAETNRRNIAWNIHPLPTVRADRALLRLVLVNLISNAVKFTGQRAEATIEIGTAPAADGMAIILIRDNGAGFDPQYAHKLFGVFQRLHSNEQFEGTGIGLANVQRIIHRFGGRVWAEGTVAGGATFYFSLPKKDEATPAT
jgi:PAS domain S-box-containing protein